ncbi:cytochrome P450, partial [Leucogyrophana mollusca]
MSFPQSLNFTTTCGVLLSGLCAASLVRLVVKARSPLSSLPLPPGPRPLPIVGNVKDAPTSFEWLTFAAWGKTYGDVVHFHVFGKSVVVLNSLKAAKSVLESQSAITSDRPRFAMISDLMGWSWALQFMSMGPRFRKYRKTVHRLLHAQAVRSYSPMIHEGSLALLNSLLEDPEHFQDHLKHHSGGLMMTILYGEKAGSVRDQYVHNADKAIDGLVLAGNFGNYLVDFLPFLKYVPEWMPGAGFKQKARIWRQDARNMIEIPFRRTKQLLDGGSVVPSVMSKLVNEQVDSSGEITDEELIMGAIGVLYVGGGDTALSALTSFVLAMLLHPEAQARAQAEISEVVGSQRLPDFSDRAALPYFECIMLEVLRWNPAVPLGVPHRCMEDCNYNNYRIPAGATVLANQWAILHDEDAYEDPLKFRPERFLDASKNDLAILDPREASFGFGRRVCPGRHFADDLLWLLMIHIIASFEISPVRDADGRLVMPSGAYLTGLVTHPEPFKCTFTPRSTTLAQLIRSRN